MKSCFKCLVQKPLSEFYKHKRMADGHLGKCKDCTKADTKENRSRNIDYYREYDRKRLKEDPKVKERNIRYRGTEAGKLSAKKSRLKYIHENPVKRAAHVILGNAVKNHKIIKSTHCQECGSSGRLHGHHDDYSQPLVVQWLCPPCHKKWHDENGEAENG